MKKLKIIFLLTSATLFMQMCNGNVKNLNLKIKDGSLNKSILSYIIKGENEKLNEFLDNNKVDLNEVEKNLTYLTYAVNNDSPEIIETLISRGANPNIFMEENNLLLLAKEKGKTKAFVALINNGAKSPQNKNILTQTLILGTRLLDQPEELKLVLSAFKKQFNIEENWISKNLNRKSLEGMVLSLISPFEELNEELIYLIKEKKVNVNVMVNQDYHTSPLYRAICGGALYNIKFLLENKANMYLITSPEKIIELLFENLSLNICKGKNVDTTLLREILKLIRSIIDVYDFKHIKYIDFFKNIFKEDQVDLLEEYYEFSKDAIKKDDVIVLIHLSTTNSKCFKFLLEKFSSSIYKEDMLFYLSKELIAMNVLEGGSSDENFADLTPQASPLIRKSSKETLEMINYFLEDEILKIKDEMKILDAFYKLFIHKNNVNILAEVTLPLVEKNYFEYIKKSKGTNNSLIHAAALNGNLSVFRWALNFFNINDLNEDRETVIELALKKKNESLAHEIIKLGAKLPYKTLITKELTLPKFRGKKDMQNSTTALSILGKSTKTASENLIKEFIEKYYMPGEETLIESIKNSRLNVIEYILDNRLFKNINFIDKNEKTALDYALELNVQGIIEILEKNEALTCKDVKEKNTLSKKIKEEKALKQANSKAQLKKRLQEMKITPKEKDILPISENELFKKALEIGDLSTIIGFIKKDNSKILKVLKNVELLEKIFKEIPEIANFKDEKNNNLLIISIMNGYFTTTTQIINLNLININETNKDGNNALMIAVLENKIKIFEFLFNRISEDSLLSYLQVFNNEGKDIFSLAVENRNTKILNLIHKKGEFKFDNINKLVMNLIFSLKEQEKLSTLNTLLNIIKTQKKDFKEDEFKKLKESNLSKEILEILSKFFPEEFKELFEKLEVISKSEEIIPTIENENSKIATIENIKLFCTNTNVFDEWENFVNSRDEKIINNFNIFKNLVEDIKTTKRIEVNSKKIKFISKNLYEMKINSTRIFYSTKDKNLIILGVILYKDSSKSSRAIEYLENLVKKDYEKWDTKKFADF